MPLSWSLSVKPTQPNKWLKRAPCLSDFSGIKLGVLFHAHRLAALNGEKSLKVLFVEAIISKYYYNY